MSASSRPRPLEAARAGEPRPYGRAQRVRKRRDFQRIQGSRHRVASAHFVFLVAQAVAEADGPSRLGLVVSRKVGGSVVRARVKRLCREVFRLELSPALPRGVDLVVIARPGPSPWPVTLGYDAVASEWSDVRARLLERCRRALESGVAEIRPTPPGAGRISDP